MTDDFERRLSALEVRVDREARLRASVDFDLSLLEERQKRTLEVVRDMQIVQTNHSAMFIEQANTLRVVGTKVKALDTKVEALDTKVDRVLRLLERPPA